MPSNILESTLDHLASPVVAQSVERISQNDDDDLITLPSVKLEENDTGLEYLDQPNVEVSSSRSRVSGSQSDGQLRQQNSNDPSREYRSQPWFTTAQGEMADEFLNAARRNPFHFREVSAEPFVNFTIDTDEMSGFLDNKTHDPLCWHWVARYDANFETSFEIAWEKYYKKLFVVGGFPNVACRQWTLKLHRIWLRRHLIEIRAPKDSIIVGICCAELIYTSGNRTSDLRIGSTLEFLYASGVLLRETGSEKRDIALLAKIIPIFNTHMRLDVSQSECEKWFHYIDIEDFLALKLSELMVLVHFCTQEVNPSSKELGNLSSKFLTIEDLNAGSLAENGGIKLVWTNVTEEHFLLNRDTGEY